MKRYTESAIILLAVLALVGCSKTEEFQHNPDSALQIESVSGISPFALTTKAVITGNTLPGSDAATGIGIFVTASDGSAYDGHNKGYTNVNFANSGSGWSTATPVYLSDTQGKLYGYFPYNSEANDLRAIPVQSSLNGTDYLYAEPQTVSHSNKSVSLQMQHALSRLHLTIKKGANFTAEAPLSKITLKSTAIDATGTMDLITGAITATKKSGETGTVELTTDGTITAEGIEKDILLVPADNSEGKKGISISLLIDGKPAGITLSGDNGLDIRSGIQNNVTLTIEDTGIKVTGIGVGTWGDGGSQQVQVGAHTVTVKLSEDTGIADDVLTNVKVDGKNVIIKAYSVSGQHLKCSLGEGVFSPLNKTSNLVYTFTLSNIASDITATIGYAKPVTVNVSSNIPGSGTARIEGECYEGETISFIATEKFGAFIEWQDADGNILSKNNPYDVILTADLTAIAVFADYGPVIPGVFTVSDDNGVTKTPILFSQGNLYYDGSKFNFEANQYGFNSSYQSTYVSHFYWSKDASVAYANSYNESGTTGSDVFFTNADETTAKEGFTVNVDGKEQSGWRTLSTNEWQYLFNTRTMTNGKDRYTLNITYGGKMGLVLYPDDYSGSTLTSGIDYTDANFPADCVFLPAAGRSDGSNVYNVGDSGYYWSSTANGSDYAYYVYFYSSHVYPHHGGPRNYGFSVRLITESK